MDEYPSSSSITPMDMEDEAWMKQISAATSMVQQRGEPTSTTKRVDYPSQYYDAKSASATAAAMKREQKRRPKPKDGTQLLCGVCGDRALGYNFDAITCESCKAFFRRNALKTKVFTCSFEGNCKLDAHTRKFCSGCRLKKCVEIGMKKEWILSDDQLAKRRKKGEGRPLQQSMSRSSDSCSPHSCGEITTSTNFFSDESQSPTFTSSVSPIELKYERDDEDYPRPLSEEIRLEIENLEKEYNAVFSVGYSKDQAQKFTDNPRSANELFNMTDIFIRRLIKFAKHIPEFKDLKQEDQIYLLKGGIMEIMVLRSAMGFDTGMQKWKVKEVSSEDGDDNADEKGLDPKMIASALGNSMYTEHVKFVTSLHELTGSNRTVMTLMFVIELFSSDRPNIVNKELVSKAQEKFSSWLQAYLESIYSVNEARQLYPKLLVKLLDVRNLGESSAKLASHLDITKLEPLLIEVFSLQK